MSGLHLLIAAIIIVFVAAFIITMLVVNANAKKIIGTNSKLVQNQNMLVEQNKQQGREIEALQKQQEELAEKLKHAIPDKEMQLRQQIQEHREHIERTADMTDDELLAWVDLQMEEKKLYTDTDLSLKTMAKALGLTQKRLGALFKDHAKYGSLGEYINEKRFLYACQLLREQPNWTIEAVGAEAGFGGRRTFQTEVKRRLGITPLQYRQSQGLDVVPKHK
jgi:AraC-like DNA-binding protein